MQKFIIIKIYGLVQGVFFRQTAQKIANKLQIKGLAKNELDGSLYIEAEGEEQNLEKFLDWCKRGPPLAKVRKIEIIPQLALRHFKQFSIQ
jgi:acylphosphatase